MIDFYTWSTPNGRKVSIMLEEVGLAYRVHAIDIMKDEQFAPDFLAVSPNNKIPAIVDVDTGLSLFESGAILMYLANKTGQLWPASGEAHWRVVEWLMWQMGGFGPMLGQTHFFVRNNTGKAPFAEQRFLNETRRLYGVLERRLATVEYVAGAYSIADIAIWPWAARFEWHGVDLNQYPSVARWYRAIAARPAVQKGYHVPVAQPEVPMP